MENDHFLKYVITFMTEIRKHCNIAGYIIIPKTNVFLLSNPPLTVMHFVHRNKHFFLLKKNN